MDAMTVLRRCRASGADLEALDVRIRQRRDAVTTITVSLDRAGGRGPASDRMASAAAEIADMERQQRDRRERQAVELVAVSLLAERLPPVQGQVVYLYYGKAMTLRAVAKRVRYTEGYVRKLRREAEEELRRVPHEEVDELLPAWYVEWSAAPT